MTTDQPRCENCRHRFDDGFISVLECRRRAPIYANFGQAQKRVFPMVDRKDWCGEFEAKPE